MKILFFTKGLEEKEDKKLRDYIEKKTPQFERLLSHFAQDAVTLHVNVKRFEKNNAFRVEMLMKLPSKSFKSREDSHSIEKAVDLSKDRLVKQLKKHTSSLRSRGQSMVRITDQLNRVHQSLSVYRKEENEPLFQETLRPLLKSLERFVRQELFHSESEGKLPLNSVRPESVIDDVIVEAYQSFQMHSSAEMLEQTLYQIAIQKIEERAREARKESETKVSLEERRESEDTCSADYIERELATFEADSEMQNTFDNLQQKIEEKEKYNFLLRALSHIPSIQRQTFILSIIEKFGINEIAKIQNRSEEEVENDIQQVKNVLTERAKEEFA